MIISPSPFQEAPFALIIIFITGTVAIIGKMAVKTYYLLVIFFLSGLFPMAQCGTNGTALYPTNGGYNSGQSENNLVPLLMQLVESRPLNIQLLYDKANEEKAQQVSRDLSKEMSGLMAFQFDPQSETPIDKILGSAAKDTSLVTLCSFQQILDLFQKIKVNRTKSHSVNWVLLFEIGEVRNESMAALQSLVNEGTRVTLVIQEKSETMLVYSANVKEDGVMRFYYKGRWGSEDKHKRPQLKPLYDPNQYLDMKGRQLYVAANDDPPYMTLGQQQADGSVTPISGIDFKILESLRRNLNFTYKIFSPADGAWGSPQPDGTINGMVGMVARREVHLAVTGIAISVLRFTVIDYTKIYYLSYMCIYSRALSEKNRGLAIFTPFRYEVWICVILSTLVMGPVLKIQSKILERFSTHESQWDLQTYSFNIYRTLVLQGNLLDVTSLSQRIIFFFWYIFCLVVYALYSGSLTAVFAVPAYEKPIDSLVDLPRAVKNGFTLTVVGDTTNEYIFKEATEGILKQTWDLFNHKDRSKSFLDSSEKGMRLVLEEKTVHLITDESGRLLAASLGRRDFYVGREFFFPQFSAFALPQGSPYKVPFDKVIRRIIDAGLISKWNEDEIKKFSKQSGEIHESRSLVITLVNLQAAFFLLILGIFLATVVLLGETFVWLLFYKGK